MSARWCWSKVPQTSMARTRARWWIPPMANGGSTISRRPTPWAAWCICSPCTGRTGWPLMGVDLDGNGVGNPVTSWTVPKVKKSQGPHLPQTSDSFESSILSPQWQFCHNPHNDYWSLTENPGRLTIKGQRSTSLMMAHNIITQKIMGWKSLISVTVDVGRCPRRPDIDGPVILRHRSD